ncbi:MAG TPA: FGGY family carbohydrate kinase [Geminicoccaceae bacterium]|nr:FGGY family carbohydrate kinase [Geminicoccaceae bacterium]
MPGAALVAVDVGTGSARAGVFGPDGRMLGRAERPIALHRPMPDHAEQSSDDIWSAVAQSVREARTSAGVAEEEVAGVSFDATCSLVALDHEDRPASVSTTGEDRWNVVVWLVHRAIAEAEACTATSIGCWTRSAAQCRPKWRSRS